MRPSPTVGKRQNTLIYVCGVAALMFMFFHSPNLPLLSNGGMSMPLVTKLGKKRFQCQNLSRRRYGR